MAGKLGGRLARVSESKTGAIDERVESRTERKALREAHYSQYASYKRTLRSSKGSLLVVYEIRVHERSAARSNAQVKLQREAMHRVKVKVGSKDDDSKSGNTTNSWLGVLSTDALVTGPLHSITQARV
jgi:hypothetical protein